MEEVLNKVSKALEEKPAKQIVISRGYGPLSLLGVAFVVLKLMGYISWSWWWVLAPFWIPIAIVLTLIVGILLFIIIGSIIVSKLKSKDFRSFTSTTTSNDSTNFTSTETDNKELTTYTETTTDKVELSEKIIVENPIQEVKKKVRKSRKKQSNEQSIHIGGEKSNSENASAKDVL